MPITTWPRELRHAIRRLLRRPAFAATVVATLALGIGAFTAVYAVVETVLLRPLPYANADRIVVILHHAPGLDAPELEMSEGMVRLYRSMARTIDALATTYRLDRNLTGGDRPARVSTLDVTSNFFDVVGAAPLLGRLFTEDDAEPGAEPVAILTHAGWQSHFGGDPAAVGRDVEIDGARTRIIGVMPASFYYEDPGAVALLPRRVDPDGSFGTFGWRGLARLAPGVPAAEAQREIAALQRRIPEMFPNITPAFLDNAQWTASVTPLRELVVRDVETVLWLVLGTAGFILLVAGANVANLHVVRAETRSHEVAVRGALGAGGGRRVAGLLAEHVLVAAAGGALGIAAADAITRALVAAGPAELPRLNEVAIGGSHVLVAALATTTVAALAALIALPRIARRPVAPSLRGGRGDAGARIRQPVRKLLVAAQVAAALVLLAGSGLMLRSFQRLKAVDPGVRTEGVLTFGISLGAYESAAAAAQLYQTILDDVGALPGVAAVGMSNSVPTEVEPINGSTFHIRSRPREEGEVPAPAMFVPVTPGFFEAMGIPVHEGRTIERQDHEQARRVAWVNVTFADRFLDGAALGEQIRFERDTAWLTIEGVVGDVRMWGPDEEVRPIVYLPMTSPTTGLDLGFLYAAVHSTADPRPLFPSIRAAVERAAPNVPITAARTIDRLLAASTARTSLLLLLLGGAALVALLLGAIGLYGVVSHVVAQQTRELGVRIALGARPRDVRALVVRHGLVAVAIGIVVGLGAAIGLTRLMTSLLFEVSPLDPVALGAAVLVLVAVACVASYVPARRASAADPVVALRGE